MIVDKQLVLLALSYANARRPLREFEVLLYERVCRHIQAELERFEEIFERTEDDAYR